MKLKKSLSALMVAGLLVGAGSARAAIVLDNWTLNLDAAIAGLGSVTTVKQLTYNALFHDVSNSPTAGSAVGDTAVQDVLGTVSGIQRTNGTNVVGTSTAQILNFNWELTFQARTDSLVTAINGTGTPANPFVSSFTHQATAAACAGTAVGNLLANSGCILNVYLDGAPGGAPLSQGAPVPAGGGGMTDGTLVASFQLLAGNGATFSNDPTKLDGSDDSTWSLTFNYTNGGGACVLKDSSGACLALGSTLAIVNSTTDSDPDNNGLADTTVASGPFAGLCGQTLGNQCGVEEGKLQLAVPEPGTLALLGASLIGLAGIRRRRS